MKIRILTGIFSFLFIANYAFSQAGYNVTATNDAKKLVDGFVDNKSKSFDHYGNPDLPNISTSNEKITCPGNAAGTLNVADNYEFNGHTVCCTGSNGIVLTTGSALNLNYNNKSYVSNVSNNAPGNSLLSNIIQASTKDACVLEFDFVSNYGNVLEGNIPFGTEECQGSGHNDVSGVFLTGPRPESTRSQIPDYLNENIGRIGDYSWFSDYSTVPPSHPPEITYNNIHSFISEDYLIYDCYDANNSNNGIDPFYSALIIPGEKYHIAFAIADASDDKYDSGIFLFHMYAIEIGESSSCTNTDPNQNRFLTLSSPISENKTIINTNLNWSIINVPALTASTDNKYVIHLQVAKETYGAYGEVVPDWVNAFSYDQTYSSLSPGSFSYSLSSLLNNNIDNNCTHTLYWRVGIQYKLIDLDGHQPITWSSTEKFYLNPSDPTIPSIPYITSSAHTNDINWVYGVSYLDNNVTQEGISYIDGLGKTRQVQSKQNSQNNIMAVETAYSEEGASPVQTLPAPTGSTNFGYANRFFDVKTGSNWRDFSTQDFDRKVKTSTGYNPITPTAVDNTITGSVGNFYSSNNADAYIDVAGGYPYSYTLAETSPVQRPLKTQGGVGEAFKMTGGHEYQYLYSHPSKAELEHVYGKGNSPDTLKIAKTEVIDPNGVGSITYKDNEGKVIATSLSACSPASLNPLSEDGMHSFTVHVNPVATDVFDQTNMRRNASSKFPIRCEGTPVHIDYALDLNSFSVNGIPCVDCQFDVKVRITNDLTQEVAFDNTQVLQPSASLCGGNAQRVSVLNQTISLNGPATFTITRNIVPHVDPTSGVDVLTKALSDYKESVLLHKTDSLQAFKDRYYTEESFYLLRNAATEINNPPFPVSNDCYEVSNFTGTGVACDTWGTTATAEYNQPRSITKGGGDYYIVDQINSTIRHITSKGLVQVLAGKSCATPGYIDGNGEEARFNDPFDIAYYYPVAPPFSTQAIDPVPVLYVADRGNNRIRKVTLSGNVTTYGGQNGELDTPEGLAVDKNGIVYVASTGNNKIFKITGDGVARLIAGNGTAGSQNGDTSVATFNQPTDVAVDNAGNLYVTERGNNLIRKISTNGIVSTLCGSGSPGDNDDFGTLASINAPASIGVDITGNLYFSDAGNHKIKKVAKGTLLVSTVAGMGVSGYKEGKGDSAKFNSPGGLYVDKTANIYVADVLNHRVRRIQVSTCPMSDTCTQVITINHQTFVIKNPRCFPHVWYVDKIDTLFKNGSINIVNCDGDANLDKVPGDEKYTISQLTSQGAANAAVQKDFTDAYLRMFWRNLTGKIQSMEVFKGSGGNLDPNLLASIGDNKQLFTSDNQPYYILKVKMSKPDCSEQCKDTVFAPACNQQCEEQRLAYLADQDSAYRKLAKGTGKYSSNTLKQLVDNYYPLNSTWYNMLNEHDDTLYSDYENKRDIVENFNIDNCIGLCGNSNISPCETCQINYTSSVFGNMDELSKGYEYLMDKWTAANNFPFNLDQLKPLDDPNNVNSPRNPDPDILSSLGKPLFDFLLLHINDASTSDVKTKTKWEELGDTCYNCQPMALGDCVPAPVKDMSQYPKMLMPLLRTANLQCMEDYQGCIQMNGDAATQAAYMCSKSKADCAASLAPPSDPYYTNSSSPGYGKYNDDVAACQNLNCQTLQSDYRKDVIYKVLVKLYPDADQRDTVDVKASQIQTATASMSLLDLEKYLSSYEQHQACMLACEKAFNDNFDQWFDHVIKGGIDTIRNRWVRNCFGKTNEVLDISYDSPAIYHFTLYNYDKANNLVSTVPPEGIDYIRTDSSSEVERNRLPVHRMLTTYENNSLYTTATTSPDEGRVDYLYDKAGRIRFSQNDEQRARSVAIGAPVFSYTKYDNESGRITEVGEFVNAPEQIGGIFIGGVSLSNDVFKGFKRGTNPNYETEYYASDKVDDLGWPDYGTDQQTYINYDSDNLSLATYGQTYLDGRVSKIYNSEGATHYSYDAHGRVKFVVQEINELGSGTDKYKTIDYSYTPITGMVSEIVYQKGSPNEEFHHKYSYDTDNRLIKTEVSVNGTTWESAADYSYYVNGPLKHTSLGNQVQDIDYVYNLNGWLKAINNPVDGQDPNTENGVSGFAKDAFSEVINYYGGDYKRTGVGLDQSSPTALQGGTRLATNGPDLFNGNIAATLSYTAFDKTTAAGTPTVLAQAFKYDYLNRLNDVYAETVNSSSFSGGNSSISPYVTGVDDEYRTHISYDANGNIMSLLRNSKFRNFTLNGTTYSQNGMDDLSYKFAATTTDSKNRIKKTNNRLSHVNDAVITEAGLGDIKDQGAYDPANSANQNYAYDAKGRLIKDISNNIAHIDWTAYDKVKKITRPTGSSLPDLEFTYNAQQQRLTKKVTFASNAANNETIIYNYDASGTLMGTYTKKTVDGNVELRLEELSLYGASRLGTYKANQLLGTTGVGGRTLNIADLRFELTDHLGNVRAVVKGLKLINNDPDIVSLTDYHEFGMAMSGRQFQSSEDYRYGYQGSEKESTVDGMYTTDFRGLDVRLGRWLSPDPVTHAWQSTYCSMDNNPIALTDIMGLDVAGDGGGKEEYNILGEKIEPPLDLGGGSQGGTTGGGNSDLPSMSYLLPTYTFSGSNNSSVRDNIICFFGGIMNAWTSNNSFGVGRENPDNLKTENGRFAFKVGLRIGDGLSLFTGTLEMLGGIGGEGVSIALDATGVGAIAGVPLGIGSAVAIAHGSSVITATVLNMSIGDLNDQVHNETSEGGGGSNSGSSNNESKIGANAKKLSEKEIGEFLGDKNWHKTGAKTNFIKKFMKQLKGSTNADFYIDKDSKEILLRGNKSGAWVKTGQYVN